MKRKTAVAAALLLSICVMGFAMTGEEVVEHYDAIPIPVSTHMALKMDLIEADGSTSTRMMEEWGIEDGDLVSTIIVFRTPASVKNTRFLQVENEGRGDDKWIYLPALKRVRRIASSEGSASFMGSDASYDDMETRDIDRDTHELLREERTGSWDCYVVKAVAKDPEDSQYSYRVTWFDKATYTPVRMEMFDGQQQLLKVLTVKELTENNGYWTPMLTEYKNVQTGHATQLKVLQIEYDKPISKKRFTTQYLKTGR